LRLVRLDESDSQLCDFEYDTEAVSAMKPLTELYDRITALAEEASYKGFRIPPGVNWKPTVHRGMLTAEEFDKYVKRREPVIISLGNVTSLDVALGWKTSKWLNDSYLLERVGDLPVDIEYISARSSEGRGKNALDPSAEINPLCIKSFGLGVGNQRKRIPFRDFLSLSTEVEGVSELRDDDDGGTMRGAVYLNMQGKDMTKSYTPDQEQFHTAPLRQMFDDFNPPISMLRQNQKLWESIKYGTFVWGPN
jgi:hypothetical protein